MIIGLSGYARAGKSESGKGLEAKGWKVYAFADKLREALYALNPIVVGREQAFELEWPRHANLRDVIDEHGWDGYKSTIYNDEIRRLIQTMGTDVGRNLIGENIWVDATLKGYQSWQNWVIADVRFPNEADAIRRKGGRIIRINKPGLGPLNDHPSETSLDDYRFDAVLTNRGDIGMLHRKIQAFDVWAS